MKTIRNILVIALMCFMTFLATAQDNTISIVQSPGSYDDGFSFGLQFEHQNRSIYVGLEVYSFPKLNDITYNHLIGRIGFNHHFNGERYAFKVHGGFRGGLIRRGGFTYALLGLEAGCDYKIPNTNIFIGLAVSSDMKTDSKLWSNDDYHTVNSGLVRLGFTF